MLAVHAPDALRLAVARDDEKALTAVPGIGKKGAQRLLLELKDRLGAPTAAPVAGAPAAASVPAQWREQLHSALVGLGYSEKEALAAVKGLPADIAVADGIRAALKTLAKS